MKCRRFWLCSAAAALGLGLLTTILLAWGAMFLPEGNAWYGPRQGIELGLAMDDQGKLWSINRGDNGWHTAVTYSHLQMSGRSLFIPTADYEKRKYDYMQLPRQLRPADLDDLYMNAWYHATGWPFKAFSCSVHWEKQVSNADIIYRVEGGVQLPRDAKFNPRALPLTPLWPGLLANTLIHAAAWLALFVWMTPRPRD